MQAVGDRVRLELPEFGVEGEYQVMSVDACPSIAVGPGRVVTGVFRFNQGIVCDLVVSGETKPIGFTLLHPF